MLVYQSAFRIPEKYAHLLCGRKFRMLDSYYKRPDRQTVPSYSAGMFLDSGAFSAFRTGETLDVGQYADFLEEKGDEFEVCAGLDVIGDAKATLRNQKYLDRRGLVTIPTFHVGEDVKYLDLYLDNYPYIALGGMVPVSGTDKLRLWLINCWRRIESRSKRVKVHGFGMTDFTLIRYYPWYSIDSTSASTLARFGKLMSPWGTLFISNAIQSRDPGSPSTKLGRKKLLGWIQKIAPGFVKRWKEIGEATPAATYLRLALNAIYIEKMVQQPLTRNTPDTLGVM